MNKKEIMERIIQATWEMYHEGGKEILMCEDATDEEINAAFKELEKITGEL